MDKQLLELFASELNISTETANIAYANALRKYCETIDINVSESSTDELCQYRFISGKNSGKTCNKKAKNALNNTYYCTVHYKTKKEKLERIEKINIKPKSVTTIIPVKKFSVENFNDQKVIKGTLLIVSPDFNCCLGKFTNENHEEMTNKITKIEQDKLDELGVQYYRCEIEDEDEGVSEDIATDLNNAEIIKI